MKCFISLLIMLACVRLSGVVAIAGEMKEGPYAGSKEFERMKTLVGPWEGTAVEMGDADQKVKLEYRLTGGGSALVETFFPGTPNEMVSVYHDINGRLSMTHYCTLGNQPRMALKSSSEKELALDFIAGSNIDQMKDTHMHSLTITFEDNDHITHKWILFEGGKEKGAAVFKLTRIK